MVNEPHVPAVSWPEATTSEGAISFASEVVHLLKRRLSREHGYNRLYILLPTPSLRPDVEARIFRIEKDSDVSWTQMRIIQLPRGRCYVFNSEQRFKDVLPRAFEMGPPEITLIAADCLFDLYGDEKIIADFVLKIVLRTQADETAETRTAGLHFDSGELMEEF